MRNGVEGDSIRRWTEMMKDFERIDESAILDYVKHIGIPGGTFSKLL